MEGTEFKMTDCVHSPDATGFVPYCDHLEQPGHDEDLLIKKITDVLHGNNQWAFKKYRHGIRDAHAKSHGILRGELTIYPDLPEPYRQGIFATPGPYQVIRQCSLGRSPARILARMADRRSSSAWLMESSLYLSGPSQR